MLIINKILLRKVIEMRKNEIKDYGKIKRVLVVVDMVNGFCKEGNMADATYMNVVSLQEELINKYIRGNDSAVIFVCENHNENASEFRDFPSHCVSGTKEAIVIDELMPYVEDSFMIGKNSTSFMSGNDFKNLIDKMDNLECVEGCGVCIDICVPNGMIPLKNYFNEFNRDVDVVVNMDASETFNNVHHNRCEYRRMISKLMRLNGIRVINSKDMVNNYEEEVISSYRSLFDYYRDNCECVIEKNEDKWFIYIEDDYKCLDNIDMVVDFLLRNLKNDKGYNRKRGI